MRARNGKNLGAIWRFANEIQHGREAIDIRGAKGQIQNCPEVIFELAGYRAFDRPMAGIVDAGRHFVGHQATLIFEKLNGQNAGIVELGKNAASDIFGFALKTGRKRRRWRDGKPQNATMMAILYQRVENDVPVTATNAQNGKFPRKRNEALQDERDQVQTAASSSSYSGWLCCESRLLISSLSSLSKSSDVRSVH